MLGAVEGGLRVFGSREDIFVPDPVLGWRLRPSMRDFRNGMTLNPISSNAEGLRSPELEGRLPAVLCLGDSITFGLGVDDHQTWPSLLGEELRRLGHPAEVINGGMVSFNSTQGLLLYDEVRSKYRPAVVVAAFLNNETRLVPYRDVVRVAREDVGLKRALVRSEIYLRLLRARLRVQRFDQNPNPHEGGVPHRHLPVEEAYAENLQVLAEKVREDGARLLLVEEALDYAEGNPGVQIRPTVPPDVQERLRGVLASSGLPLVRLRDLPGYSPERFFLENDWIHPGPEGHRFMAAAVADALVREGLLDAPEKGVAP